MHIMALNHVINFLDSYDLEQITDSIFHNRNNLGTRFLLV